MILLYRTKHENSTRRCVKSFEKDFSVVWNKIEWIKFFIFKKVFREFQRSRLDFTIIKMLFALPWAILIWVIKEKIQGLGTLVSIQKNSKKIRIFIYSYTAFVNFSFHACACIYERILTLICHHCLCFHSTQTRESFKTWFSISADLKTDNRTGNL